MAAAVTAVDATWGRLDKASKRLAALGQGLAYAALAATAFGVALHTERQSQAGRQAAWTARVMDHTGGRYAVGVAGAVVVVIGLGLLYQALSRSFARELDDRHTTRRVRKVLVWLGTFGIAARGVVIALAGALVVDAAVTFRASRSTGLDGALRTLRDSPAGPMVLGVAALGLMAFGVFGLAEARYRRVEAGPRR
jgi:type IV secretory pathway VirB2 component (pilin)